jgi:predicted nucleic acid-binding protein
MSLAIRCVLDTNICIKQFIQDPLTQKVNQLFDRLDNPATEFFVPDLFYVECANTLWKYARANLYTDAQIKADLADLANLNLIVTPTKELMIEAVKIGLQYGITAYDGCYVALSKRQKATLLTLDSRLVNSLPVDVFDVQLFTNFSMLWR